MATGRPKRLAILTSGGDAPGMNAVVRSAVRTALERGAEIFAVEEGYQGLVDGGERIRKMSWESVGGILHRGGTVIGTARCAAMRQREGRLTAARNLLKERIDGLVAVGGDGTLTGADTLRKEWASLLGELVEKGQVSAETARAHPRLVLVGLVGSIDNDMAGTDMTIGADTALHRIVDAVDSLSSTAASHQRTFVVEVMGRDCGYLALMSALATGANWVLIPEAPPDVDDWEQRMCDVLSEGRRAGRRHSTVIVAEGARDRSGNPISAEHVCRVLSEKLGAEARVTVLGHVQRGGAPSAFDRIMGTLLGAAAVDELLQMGPDDGPCLIGMRENRVRRAPLMESVAQTRGVGEAIAAKDFERAMDLRGTGFKSSFRILRTLVRALPHEPRAGLRPRRFAVLTSGAPAPGMNTALRVAVRLAIDKGHRVLGVRNGFEGLVRGETEELGWMSVHGWGTSGGTELGTNRTVPSVADLPAIARTLEKNDVDGLLVVGGWTAYEAAHRLVAAREDTRAFRVPILCVPAAIDNNLPGSEQAIGADTALNAIVEAVDKIKQSAVAWKRCFVVEVMGRRCGYLALMAGLATGAEKVYLPEHGITMDDLQRDLALLVRGFSEGKRLGLLIRNESASPVFTTHFLRTLFEEEAAGLFDAREAILGHLQQGGNPTPFDRILATRFAARAVDYLVDESEKDDPGAHYLGFEKGKLLLVPMREFPAQVDAAAQRPREQWWLDLEPILHLLAQPGPGAARTP